MDRLTKIMGRKGSEHLKEWTVSKQVSSKRYRGFCRKNALLITSIQCLNVASFVMESGTGCARKFVARPLWNMPYMPQGPAPQWGAADADIKVPSGENTEFKLSPFKAWSRSVCSHTCYAYCQGFLPYLFLPVQVYSPAFFSKTSPDFFLCWLWLTPVPM